MLSALLLAMPALTGNISVLDTVADTPAESTVTPDANVSLDSNANAAIDANANVNVNAASNVAVVVNTNTLVNAAGNSNVATKIDEPKPVQTEPSNR